MNTGYTVLTQLNQNKTLELRNEVERICKYAEQLSEPDRTLVRMYLENENSFRQMSQLLGVSETAVARHIRKIIDRLGSGAVNGILNESSRLGYRHRKIARDYFLRGLTAKKIAHKYGITYYGARKIINLLRTLIGHHRYKTTVRKY